MITNEQMKHLLDAAAPIDTEGLPADLRRIADAEWGRSSTGVLSPDGPPPTWTESIADSDPEILMRTELEVNDFKIDDDDLIGDPGTYLDRAVSRGLGFAGACLLRARGMPEARDLRAVVSTGVDDGFLTHGTTVKFFLMRGGLPERYQDIERFKIEGIALIGLADLPALGIEG